KTAKLPQPLTPLEALDHGGDRLAEADAHRRDAVPRAAPLKLAQERRSHPGAGRAERMAERDAAAVRVDVGRALVEARVANDVAAAQPDPLFPPAPGDAPPRGPRPVARGGARLRVSVQHQPRVDACEPERDEPCPRLEAEPLTRVLACDE